MAASKTTSSKRDWGKGMACVGRTKVCTIVPPDHFGPVPGVEVGTSWMFRMQASEAGIHRPHVAGIHGREDRGAFSIVLSGGYEDDVDNGDEFWYTGSGGRDLSGNKRTAAQSSDQKLTRMNRISSHKVVGESASVDPTPVREWMPSLQNILRRYQSQDVYNADELGICCVGAGRMKRDTGSRVGDVHHWRYPENYLEAMASKEKTEGKKTPKAIESHKRKRLSSRNSEENIDVHEGKKVRPEPHSLEKDLAKLIDQDINTKLWGECKKHLIEGTQKFLENVMEQFLCICCQDLVFEPVTTECLHTFCKRCLHRSFAAQVYTCPCCRTELGKDYEMEINEPLSQILVKMFPGYTAGRN
uniref:Uncharacterized protein n=1 Tax=Timema bartmani TaxID=61472 RepID=A0A7R9F4F1_9NEOP|nr:unnamed protein product [Timema bartmani]